LSSKKKTSLELFRLRKTLATLANKEGKATELITFYVPPGKQISDAISMLRNEYGTASNIKSTSTRKNVQEAIVKVQQRLKLFKAPPKNGLVVFCGAIPQNGAGSERMETYVVVPPEPISIYLYRCDSRFHTEHLAEQLRDKETYGIILIDASKATIATIQGKRLKIVRELNSGVPGKTRAGGQSARRYERLRNMRLQEYFKRVADHAKDIFLSMDELKGLILAGPGPTKYDFDKGEYLNYILKNKIIDTIDTAYVEEQGVKEVVEKAPEIMKKVRYIEEKQIMQKFLYEVGHDTGKITYGEQEVRGALKTGAVRTLLISEAVDPMRVTIRCGACNFKEDVTIKKETLAGMEEKLSDKQCDNCGAQSLTIENNQDLIDNLAELAESSNTTVEIISSETEEGQMLKKAFGGIAAILRFRMNDL
jgi:peptide chain release factor subunit 1